MRKTILKVVTLVGVVGFCSQLLATTGELRTPLARFPYHYPLVPVDDGLWSFNCFHTAYMRSADKAFDVCHGRNSVHLSKLFFGKSEFRGEEAFFGGMITDSGVVEGTTRPKFVTAPPALKFAKIRPRFEYCEKGVNFGIEAERRLDDSSWFFGGQLSLPFKVIDVERNVCSATMTDLEESFDDVVCRKNQTLFLANNGGMPVVGRAVPARVPAYRLDFLSSLCRANGAPMVEYGDGTLRIAGIEVAQRIGAAIVSDVAVLSNLDGKCPATPNYASPTSGTGAGTDPTILGIQELITNNWVTGAGVISPVATPATRGAFTSEVHTAPDNPPKYAILGADRTAQGRLHVVPVYLSKPTPANANTNTAFTTQAAIIMNTIDAAINDLETTGVISAEQYFFDQGVHFCQCDRIVGLGDLDLNLYVGYDFNDDFWGKLDFGVIFPTGKKICDVGQLLAQPTGNNGHFEIKVGLDLGWKRWKWIAWHLDAYYNHVFNATELRAAPFTGATVKNIGPAVQAKVRWGYFTGHLDATIFHPENQNLGCTFGYEAYVKRCDKICLCTTTAKEFELRGLCGQGDVQNPEEKELDASILAQDTKRVSHKLRGQVFHRWDYCEIFAGASRVIGGKNIMREAEGHVGFGIYW